MKQRIKHFSKSTLSVILAVCMLLSCFTAGIIATDAAKAEAEKVGAAVDTESVGDYSALGNIFYDNSQTNWTNVYCFIGKGDYLKAYSMTATKNPSVFTLYNDGWGSRTKLFFADAASSDALKGSSSLNTSISRSVLTGGSTNYTDWITCSNDDASHIFFPASSSGGALTRTYTKVVATGAYNSNLSLNPSAGYFSTTDDVMNATSTTVRTRTYTGLAAGTYAMYMANYNSDSGKINKIGTATGCTLETEGSNLLITITQPSNVTITFVDDSDDDLDVTATPLETTHPVTVNISGTGTVTANGEAVTSGSSITVGETTATSLEATAGENYHFVNWTTTGGVALGSAANEASNSITVSADGATLTANFAENTKYNVTSVSGGTVDRNPAQYYEGETVTITPTVTSGKTVASVTVTKAGGGTVQAQASGDNYTFQMPADNVSIVVTLRDLATITVTTSASPSDKGSVTPASGTTYTENDTITFTATPLAGKTFDHWTVTEGNGTPETRSESTFTQIAGAEDITATAYFVDGYTVNVTIDDPTHGTVEGVSHPVAAAGQEITVTWNTKALWKYKELRDSNNQLVTTPTLISASSTEIKFTMPSANVNYTIITESKISSSTYKYYGYDYSSEKLNTVTGFNGIAFSESYIGDDTTKKFSYIYIDRSSDTNTQQSFSVENTAAAVDVNTIYFEDTANWGSVHAYFFNSSGSRLLATGQTDGNADISMNNIQCDNNGHSVYAVTVPPTAVKVQFLKENNNDSPKTNIIDLSTSYNFYWNSGGTATPANSTKYPNVLHHYLYDNWNNDQVSSTKGVDVYNNGKKYGSNINLNSSNFQYWLSGGNNAKNLKVANVQNSNKVPYYLVVYYPQTDYGTVNGVTIDLSGVKHPVIVAQTFLPGEKPDPVVVTSVKVVAKDGAVRRYGASRNPGSDQDYSTFEKHADTYLTNSAYNADPDYSTERKGYGSSDTYDYASKVEKGTKIYFKTTVDSSKRGTYYVKAFSINGVVYDLLTANTSTGEYTGSFTIPLDYDRDYVEITPIYYFVNPGATVRFTVQGYDKTVMDSGWGNTLYVYPYWSGLSKANNGFGGYPGQPMIFYKGEYFIEIPVTYNGKTVKGMTLNNGYWDDIHYKVVHEVSKHHQTYDYDDFYKIYKEYPQYQDSHTQAQRRIICSFKFRTKKNNDKPSTVTPSNYETGTGNGWEVLTNYEGKPVDIFGKELNYTVADIEAMNHENLVHVISQDYKQNCAGHYATEWAVYGTDKKYKEQIIPSALTINEANIGHYLGLRTSAGYSTSQVKSYMNDTYGSSTAEFADEYVALDSLRDTPAMITYEKSIWGGDDPAERCDARWYWSYTTATVNANMRVAVSTDGGTSFPIDGSDPLANNEVPPITGANVSFGSTASTKSHVLSNQAVDSTVTLSADSVKTNNGNTYTFVGWYAVREGVAQFVGTDPSQSNIPLTSNVTFEARYVKTTKGAFTIGHLVHPASTGEGTVTISAQLKVDGSNSGSAKTATNGFVDFTGLTYGGKQTIEVTLSSTPTGVSTFENFYATLSDLLSGYSADYITGLTINTSGATKTATFTIAVDKLFKVNSQTDITQAVTSMTNYSKFVIDDVELDVNIVFTFPVRYYSNKNYEIKHVKITKDEHLLYFPNAATITTLTPAYVLSKAPYQSIYRKEPIVWGTPTISGLNATTVGTAADKPTVTAVVDNGSGETTRYTANYLANFEEANNTRINYFNKENLDPPQYFQYWNIYKAKEQGSPDKQPVAICFSEHFNYAGFEDYYVEAVYGDTAVTNRQELVTGLTTNASLLSLTRSHWNNTTDGQIDEGEKYNLANTEYDRIYVDFVLSWANDGNLVNKDSKTFGYRLTYIDEDGTTKNIDKTIDKTKVDEKNRIEVAYGIENTLKNASATRTYTVTPTIDGTPVGTASQSFCLYDVGYQQAKWAR